MNPRELIEAAFGRLVARPGYVERPDQKQLALLLSDCIEGGSKGLFEAPTGLGKSLAALIPSIAHAIAEDKRVVVATFTNVLAEQYWRQDLPLALSLFDGEPPRCEFLIGRQRYACLAAMSEHAPETLKTFAPAAKLGIESEFRAAVKMPPRDMARTWLQIAAPPVCPARLCPKYGDCFYYSARRAAERAQLLITNHSVLLQDAMLREASKGESAILGDYDFLILDEAHDFPQAAFGALAFELSDTSLGRIIRITRKLEGAVLPIAAEAGAAPKWSESCDAFVRNLERAQGSLQMLAHKSSAGLLATSPEELHDFHSLRASMLKNPSDTIALADAVAGAATDFLSAAKKTMAEWTSSGEAATEPAAQAREVLQAYELYIAEYAWGCRNLFNPKGLSVSHLAMESGLAKLQHDVVGLAEPLQKLVWGNAPWACMSATLAVDGEFEFFKRMTGAEPAFEEILPSPFDFHSQAALYLPEPNKIPDPALARRTSQEAPYFDAIADELRRVILAVGGRTLALFHSRRELEEVARRIQLPDELPMLIQRRNGAAFTGERFKRNTKASLFALRSFWTGFDAPGETLSCVALVRVPFEVPVDPPQMLRHAWMQSQGQDPFATHTLAIAKTMMRQGAGRLIRRNDDRGLIAILDPRVQSKRYGEEILRNLPREMNVFRDVEDAAAWLGISRVNAEAVAGA